MNSQASEGGGSRLWTGCGKGLEAGEEAYQHDAHAESKHEQPRHAGHVSILLVEAVRAARERVEDVRRLAVEGALDEEGDDRERVGQVVVVPWGGVCGGGGGGGGRRGRVGGGVRAMCLEGGGVEEDVEGAAKGDDDEEGEGEKLGEVVQHAQRHEQERARRREDEEHCH